MGATGSTRKRAGAKSPSEQVAPKAPPPTAEEEAATERAQSLENPQPDQEAADKAAAEQREQATKAAEEERDRQLKAGKGAAGSTTFSELTVPEQRANRKGEQPLAGRVDNMTRRHDGEPLQGHFVGIDLSNSDAKRGVEAVIGEGNARFGSGDYGIYVEPGQLGDDGYPETAVVMLRDEHAATVVVPYDCLTAADAGRR